MRILQLCNKPPLPLLDGGCIAMHNLSMGLMDARIELKILTVATNKHPFIPEAYSEDYLKKTKIESVFINTDVSILGAMSSLLSSNSYNISRFYSKYFQEKLITILEKDQYDIVQLEGLYMTPYIKAIRENSTAQIALRAHNVEHLIWEQLARGTNNWIKKLYLKFLAKKIKSYEIKLINKVDCILPITDVDAHLFKKLGSKTLHSTIPFGINLDDYTWNPLTLNSPLKLFHLGALNWQPNKEGVEFFVNKIWPNLSMLPVQFNLAGRNIPASFRANESVNFNVYGEVQNAITFMAAHDIMVVPLKSGSGMRIKIIEAMALGKIVISTTIGAEGINFTNGTNILIADTDNQFINQVKFCIDNPDLAKRIGVNARKLVEQDFSNRKIIEKLVSFYNNILTNT